MADPTYKVGIGNIATDGTNLYLTIAITDGSNTMPSIGIAFPVGTSAATITAFLQTIANNRPTLTADIAALVGTSVTG